MAANPQDISSPSGDAMRVAILLGTYQGEAYLEEQLDSIAAQTHRNWTVWASDDGSSDATCSILNAYRARWGASRLHLLRGPGRGFVANFLGMVCHPSIQADYYAYADQDDHWHPDKLERALDWLASIPQDRPALYTARSQLVDADGHPLGLSPASPRPPGFANALVQNIASGNTMVFNAAARELLRQAGPDVDTPLHDWWSYVLITGCGGAVVFDPHPRLYYRQHTSNLIGMSSGWRTYIKRARALWAGKHRHHVQRHLDALEPLQDLLTPANRYRLHMFAASRRRRLMPRLLGMYRSGVYRQSRLGSWGMLLATILNKT